jgi:acetyl esterase/lipase
LTVIVLRDEGEAYARKLRAAGVDVTAVRYEGIIHDFVMLTRSAIPTPPRTPSLKRSHTSGKHSVNTRPLGGGTATYLIWMRRLRSHMTEIGRLTSVRRRNCCVVSYT